MENLYLWFASPKERQSFTKEILEKPVEKQVEAPVDPKRRGAKKKASGGLQRQAVDSILELMEQGKTKNPYYNLAGEFYRGQVPESTSFEPSYSMKSMFEKGIRRMYYQNSYLFRPGAWLVVQFKANESSRQLEEWIKAGISTERIGSKVPLPPSSKAKLLIRNAGMLMEAYRNVQGRKEQVNYLKAIYARLEEARSLYPKAFRGETIFLWEQLAFEFSGHGYVNITVRESRYSGGN